MDLRVTQNARTAMCAGFGPFYTGAISCFQDQCALLDECVDELRGKRVAFIPGGVGRVANYARSLGIDAHVIDCSKLNEQLCKRNYPEVPFHCQDMSQESDEWDAVFFEDMYIAKPLQTLRLAANWQRVCSIYPKTFCYDTVSFDSETLHNQMQGVEPEHTAYIQAFLRRGEARIVTSLDQFDEYEQKTHCINLNQTLSDVNHEPGPHEFFAIGFVKSGSQDFTFYIYVDGIHERVISNQRWQFDLDAPERVK